MATAPASRLEQLDRDHLIHPITELRIHEVKGPRVIVGGKGIRLETARVLPLVIAQTGLLPTRHGLHNDIALRAVRVLNAKPHLLARLIHE